MLFNKKYLSLTALFFLIFYSFSFSDVIKKSREIVLLDKNFYMKLSGLHQMIRDDYLDEKINSMIQGRGVIISIEKKNRYNRDSRLIIIPAGLKKYNLKIKYYIFLNDKTSISMLAENMTLEFKGQFMNYTPVNIKRNEYIFDIVLESGAVLVER